VEETFDYDALAAAGFETVVIDYYGSSDEGYVNEVTPEPIPEGVEISDDLETSIKEAVYDILERHHGGWEINEGSEGKVTINVKARTATLSHGDRVESVNWLADVEV
jgi:hypothetical protein